MCLSEVKRFRRGLPGLCFPSGQLSCFVSMANLSQDPSLCAHTPLSQDGFQCKGLLRVGGRWQDLWYWRPLPLDPWEVFPCMCSVSPAPWRRHMWTHLSLKQDLTPFCPCHDYYPKVSTGDRVWLFALFLFILSENINKSLVVNA